MRISVIIPAYDAERTLGRAIDSILHQLVPVAEIILVDDGSTDGTAQVAQKYGPALRYFYHPNAGIAASRNRGLQEARSEWIAFLDADDEWLPHWVSAQESLRRVCPRVLWSCCNFEHVFHETSVNNEPGVAADFLGAVRYFDTRVRGVTMATPGFLIHRSVFDKVGLFKAEMRSGQDDDMWERIAMRYPSIGYCASICWRYWHDNVHSVTKTKRARDLHVRNLCENARLAQSLGPEVFEAYYPWGRKRAMSYVLRVAAGQVCIGREVLDESKVTFPLSFGEQLLEAVLKVLPTPIAKRIID